MKKKERTKSPLGVAALENIGFFEGRVVKVAPKENKTGIPQVYTTVEQRIRRPEKGRVHYVILHFAAFGPVAKSYLQLVKPGQHVRLRYRAGSWAHRGHRGRMVLSLQIMAFRVYRGIDEDLEAWMEDDGFLDGPPEWAWEYDPAEDGIEVRR